MNQRHDQLPQPCRSFGAVPLWWRLLFCIFIPLAGLCGWIVAWRMWEQRDELAEKQKPRVVSVLSESRSRQTAPAEVPGPEIPMMTKDKRTLEFLENLSVINAAAKPGSLNAQYLKAGEKVLLDSNSERRARNFGLLMEHLRPEDALPMHEALLAMHRQGRPYEEYRLFATKWGEVDGKGAMDYYKSNPDSKLSPRDIQDILKGWGQSAPLDALTWIGANPDTAKDLAPASAVVRGWSGEDPEAATAWLLANSTSPQIAAMGVSGIMEEQLYGKGIHAAGEWLARLPDTDDANAAARAGWISVQRRLDRLSAEDAGDLWRTLGNKSWMGWNEFQNFTRTIANANGNSENEFLNAAASKGGAEGITSQFERWTASDPELTSQWLTQHSADSPFGTAAIRGMVRYLEKTDPQAAEAWRRKLPL